jgi:hypothetical protein
MFPNKNAQASSECDPAVRCHSVGPIEYYCGPYQVSRRYWKQGKSPGSDPSDPFGESAFWFSERLLKYTISIHRLRGLRKQHLLCD